MAALEIRSLTKRYGDVTAVQDLSLAIETGSVHGLLGPNGSGKTTTLSCALGLMRPSSGEVEVLGVPSPSIHRTLGRVGVVFDASILIRSLSVRGNLEYAARLRGHRGGRTLDEVLELVGIAHLARRPGGKLSLGQSRRLAIAIALAGRPELLVLDEPLSGLDPLGVRQVLRLVERLCAEGLTIVLSSHRLHEMQPVLTHASILLGGRLAGSGPLEELLTGAGRYRLRVDAPRRARELIDRFEGATLVGDPPPEEGSGELLVELGRRPVAPLNRALVEGGVGVSGITPEGSSLPELFESLVDEAEAGRAGRAGGAGGAGENGARG